MSKGGFKPMFWKRLSLPNLYSDEFSVKSYDENRWLDATSAGSLTALKTSEGFKGVQSLIASIPITELEEMLASANIDVTKLVDPRKGKKTFSNKSSEAWAREICLETSLPFVDPELELENKMI